MYENKEKAWNVRNVGSGNQFRVIYIFSEIILLKFLSSSFSRIPPPPIQEEKNAAHQEWNLPAPVYK